MPRVNIHIRQEDWHIWQAIEDKPEWIHHNLNKTERTMKRHKAYDHKTLELKQEGKVIKPKRINKGFTKDKLCQHFEYRGLCPVKGCENYIGDTEV